MSFIAQGSRWWLGHARSVHESPDGIFRVLPASSAPSAAEPAEMKSVIEAFAIIDPTK